MTEINKEVCSDKAQENELNALPKAYRGKCSMAQQNDKQNSTMEYEYYECSNMKSPDSAIGNIGSVESYISNTESDFSSPYCVSDASPSTVQESPFTEDPITPRSELPDSSTSYARLQSNEEQIIAKQQRDQRKQQYCREKEQLGISHVVESKSLVPKSREYLAYIRDQKIRKVKEYKAHLQGNWKYLKTTVDYTMVQSFDKVGLAREDEFRRLKNQKLSKVADKLIMSIIQKIENDTDIMNFENTIGQAVCKKLTIGQAKYFCTEDKVQMKNWNLLVSNRNTMIDHFLTDDIEKVKDWFVQECIINIDENDEITNKQGFYERQNTQFTGYFVEKFIIGKSLYGSYQCLVECLEMLCKQGKTRLRELLQSLKTDKINHTDANTKGPIVSMSVMPTGYKDANREGYRITAGKDLKFTVQFTKDDDAEKKKVYKEVIDKAKTKNGSIGRELGACIDKADFGSIVIHMVALRNEMIQTVVDKIRNGQFSAVIKLLLNDLKIKRYLPSGKHELEVICSVADKQKKLRRYVHKSNPIADNKSFLEEEMDTIYVLKELENHGVHIGIDVHDGDREYRARHIMTKALANNTIAKTLHTVLLEGEMDNVKNRLLQYEKVYESDASQLQAHIFKHFHEIIRKVFLDDIRRIFTERNIFKDELFKAAEKPGERHEIAMANILTEIIKMGTDAMLTLVDALYVIQLDKLADKLMKREQLDDNDHKKTKNKSDTIYINKQIHGEISDANILAIGRYELTVRRRRRTNKKRSAATKRQTAGTCTCKIKYPKVESGEVQNMCVYDVGDGDVVYNTETYLQFPVPASNIDFPYQQLNAGTNYGMTHPIDINFDIAYHGFHPRHQTTSRDWVDRKYARCYFSSDYFDEGQYTEYQRNLSSRLLHGGSCNVSQTCSSNASHPAIDADVSACFSNTGIDERQDSSMAIASGTAMDEDLSAFISNTSIHEGRDSAMAMASCTAIDEDLSAFLSNTSITEGLDSTMATDETECDNEVRNQNNSDKLLPETALSPASTTDSGYNSHLEADYMVLSPASPIFPYSPGCSALHDENDRPSYLVNELDIHEKPINNAWLLNNKKIKENHNELFVKDQCSQLLRNLLMTETQMNTEEKQNDEQYPKLEVGHDKMING